jgi:hypothetical protein
LERSMVLPGRRRLPCLVGAGSSLEGTFVKRLWSRVGVRVGAVGLLLAGLVGGVYLGQDRDADPLPDAVQVDAADMQLLKQRQSEHAAARAWQRQAEGDAATKAASEARATASRARKLEFKVKAAKERKKAEETGGPVPYTGRIPASCSEFSGSRKTGCALMLEAGFGIAEFPCLNQLWTKESGWNYKATNRNSGAYGIPQAYPGKKMSSAGADWKTNPATQIKWGLGYVKGRYDSPCGAWSHFQNAGSY